ncbi:Non-heme 11 kDa protein of cytochrome bc1 complex [Cylindrobasidium torrendii FP15055 ss-10]|uniref:Non-heme 11 kDa protein of cytochrome bc1 complex n=1 Tax=Cylindrobasidium torrendii FP15055 ss-10 TaxID=1314674 RepID=A0A0D7BP30_9AGAR|nr:Non-heme 11 kDa protein of cytochrome bc1 complex [Cylindrobasidium torrendii FP15055 ss-10]
MAILDYIASFLPTVHAEEEEEEKTEETQDEEPAAAEEEEEEEPEDEQPVIREECKESAKCKALTEHFTHCQEKVEAGEGYKGEDCVEELFHMMHCVDECAGPKLWAKLK